MPGTDHAGIATQTVVEKRVLTEEGKQPHRFQARRVRRKDPGVEGRIRSRRSPSQLKAMGCSCDWERQAFTMDEPRASAVREAFFQLFKDGLIYRGKRLVNWDPATQTALADDEVEMEEIDGHFYYLQYPLEARIAQSAPACTGDLHYVTVATTRPETMLGDTAVAINPNDPRAAALRGKKVRLPIVNRIIPIIEDDYVVLPDPNSDDAKAKFATGFLKVTPAHDPNDYELGLRHNLPMINVLAPDGTISDKHGWSDEGDAGFRARPGSLRSPQGDGRVVPPEQAAGGCEAVPPQRGPQLSQPRADRAVSERSVVLQGDGRSTGRRGAARDGADQRVRLPLPVRTGEGGRERRHSSQLETTLTPTLSRVPGEEWQGKLRFYPAALRQDLPNLARKHPRLVHQPAALVGTSDSGVATAGRSAWRTICSRSSSTRHRAILQWDRSEGRIAISTSQCDRSTATERHRRLTADLRVRLRARSGRSRRSSTMLESNGFVQDPDVLDTWFSSGLWPMSTLGWPDDTPELHEVESDHVLCTAREIITLWVSRMVMFNLYFLQSPAVHRRVHSRDDPGRRRPEDVQVAGQRRRSAGHHLTRTAPTRCGSRSPHGDQHAGRAHAGREGSDDRQEHEPEVRHRPELLQQAVERRAVR